MSRLAAGFVIGTLFGCITGIAIGCACTAIGIAEELKELEYFESM